MLFFCIKIFQAPWFNIIIFWRANYRKTLGEHILGCMGLFTTKQRCSRRRSTSSLARSYFFLSSQNSPRIRLQHTLSFLSFEFLCCLFICCTEKTKIELVGPSTLIESYFPARVFALSNFQATSSPGPFQWR